eukprot:COSAG06_NODE_52266_length_306_cov_3.135266_1_plen_37_part_01
MVAVARADYQLLILHVIDQQHQPGLLASACSRAKPPR